MSGDWTWCARSEDPAATRRLGGALAGLCRPGDLVLLCGGLGAGKTVVAQGFAAALGVAGPVTSPTFTLLRQYPCDAGPVRLLVHADLYRLDHRREVTDLAIDELLAGGAVALVEWGDVGAPVLGEDALEVVLRPEGAGTETAVPRTVRLTGRGPAWSDRAAAAGAALGPFAARPGVGS